MNRACAITGGSGFIGKNLISYLKERNSTCHALSRNTIHNITKDDFNSSGTIVHLAGFAHDLKNTSDFREYYEVNYALTKKLYNAFLSSKATKFVFISSVKAVADKVEGALSELQAPNPETDYGKSKLMAEEYLLNNPCPAGKCCYILRPCMTHGSGNKGNLNLLFKLVKSGIPYPLAAFENKRSFLSVQNFCFIVNEIITRDDIPFGIYNLADDDTLSTNEVVSVLFQASNKKAQLWKVPPSLIHVFAKLGDAFNLPLNTERLRKSTESFVVSNLKIKTAINKPLPVSAADGLKLTAESFNEHTRNLIVNPINMIVRTEVLSS
jgi:nucleoside-diphosphate-sugar epimerase